MWAGERNSQRTSHFRTSGFTVLWIFKFYLKSVWTFKNKKHKFGAFSRISSASVHLTSLKACGFSLTQDTVSLLKWHHYLSSSGAVKISVAYVANKLSAISRALSLLLVFKKMNAACWKRHTFPSISCCNCTPSLNRFTLTHSRSKEWILIYDQDRLMVNCCFLFLCHLSTMWFTQKQPIACVLNRIWALVTGSFPSKQVRWFNSSLKLISSFD